MRTQAALGYYSAPFSHQDRNVIVRNIEVPTLVVYGKDIPPVREASYVNASQAVNAVCAATIERPLKSPGRPLLAGFSHLDDLVDCLGPVIFPRL